MHYTRTRVCSSYSGNLYALVLGLRYCRWRHLTKFELLVTLLLFVTAILLSQQCCRYRRITQVLRRKSIKAMLVFSARAQAFHKLKLRIHAVSLGTNGSPATSSSATYYVSYNPVLPFAALLEPVTQSMQMEELGHQREFCRLYSMESNSIWRWVHPISLF